MADKPTKIVITGDKPELRSSPRTGFLSQFSFVPQFSLLQLLLIVTIIALSAAYYSKSVETKRQLEEQRARFQKQNQLHYNNHCIDRIFGDIPHYSNYSICTIGGDLYVNNLFRIYVNLDPSRTALIKVAYHNIPIKGFPSVAETYQLPALGQRETCRNSVLFSIILGENNLREQNPETFKAKIYINSEIGQFDISQEKHSLKIGQINRQLKSQELIFVNRSMHHTWTDYFYKNNFGNLGIDADRPNQILRIRTKPESPDPCPGILLWLEIPPEDAVLDGIEHFDSDKKQP